MMLVHPSQAAHTLGSRGSGRVQLLEGGLLGSRDSAGQGQALGRKSSAKAGLPSRSPRLPGKPPRKGGGKGSFPEHESRKGRGQPVHVAVPKRPPSRGLRQAGSRGGEGAAGSQGTPSPSCSSPTLPSQGLQNRQPQDSPSEQGTHRAPPQLGRARPAPRLSPRAKSTAPGGQVCPGRPCWGHSRAQSRRLCSGSHEENEQTRRTRGRPSLRG